MVCLLWICKIKIPYSRTNKTKSLDKLPNQWLYDWVNLSQSNTTEYWSTSIVPVRYSFYIRESESYDVKGEVPPFFMSTDQCDTFIGERQSIHDHYRVSKSFLNLTLDLLHAYEVSDRSATAAWPHRIWHLYFYSWLLCNLHPK